MTDQIKMLMAAADQERDLVEKQLRKMAEKAGFDFWYIGNIESWGDDRQLRFGKDGVVYECSAANLTTADIQGFINATTNRRNRT